jgi:CRP/FNR family transcriptional regulator/CRP/FNR family cyclic AMP-dependent transcriptional regulator
MDLKKTLKMVPLFASLKDDDLQSIISLTIPREYQKDQPILREDDSSSEAMFVILDGEVKVSINGPDGREAILAILEEGDFFGEMSVIDGEPRSATVRATMPTNLVTIRRKDLLDKIAQTPALAEAMLIEFSKRLRKANRQIYNLAMLSVYGRVASVIKDLAEERGRLNGDMITVEDCPTHQEMAEMAGTARETVTRVLSKLQKCGAIVMEKHRLIILDKNLLKYED